MVRFSVECVLPISQHVFWQVRDTYTFMRFLMTDGILKHISAGAEQVDADGWATRRAEYCPVNVDCPEFVRRVVGDTMFELSDEQRWNDSVRPYHLTFVIRPSFLTKLSNTKGELEVRPFPAEKQPQPQIAPEQQPVEQAAVSSVSDDGRERTSEQQQSQEVAVDRDECNASAHPEAAPDSGSQLCSESESDREHEHGHDNESEPVLLPSTAGEQIGTTEPLVETPEAPAAVDVIDAGAVSPCSQYNSFEDLDDLLDDSPLLPEVTDKAITDEASSNQPPSSSNIDDIASEIDSSASTDTGDGDSEGAGHRDESSDGDASDNDSNNNNKSTHADHAEDAEDANKDCDENINDDDRVGECVVESAKGEEIDADALRLEWIDDGASEDKDLDVSAEIDRLPVEEKCLLEVSGRTSVRIITIGWFIERTIVHNLRQFYGDYPGTLLRFRRMLYRRFANGDQSVPFSVIVERLLEWERINKDDLESALEQFCKERSKNSSRDKNNNNRPQRDILETNSTCAESENVREETSIAVNHNTDPQLEKAGAVPVSV